MTLVARKLALRFLRIHPVLLCSKREHEPKPDSSTTDQDNDVPIRRQHSIMQKQMKIEISTGFHLICELNLEFLWVTDCLANPLIWDFRLHC